MSLNDNDHRVAVNFSGVTRYFDQPPFHPSERYPEYEGPEIQEGNDIYSAVRQVLYQAELDPGRYGTPEWNPFGEFIEPGMTVFIKPNTVRHFNTAGHDVHSIINHASLLRPVLDYTAKALQGEGRIIIGDSQVLVGHFDKAYKVMQIDKLLEWYREWCPIPIECFDLRMVRSVRTYLYGKWGRKKVEQDPRGYRFVDLGDSSCFKNIDPKKLRMAEASFKNMYKHHSGGKHEYLFPQSVLDSDVIINIPKLKTHRRTSVTLAIKNFMGMPAWKDTLPHFMVGAPEEGGDQYVNPSKRKDIVLWLHDRIQSTPYIPVKFIIAIIKKLLWETRRIVPFKDDVYEAMWPGNDTLWRTLLDLNRAVLFADREGQLQEKQQRGYFTLMDGFIAGEKDGPVGVDPVPAGVVMAARNPVPMDLVAASLMGFDVQKMPMIWNAFGGRDGLNGSAPTLYDGDENEIEVNTGDETLTYEQFLAKHNLRFEPHPNWKGHVERE